MLARKGLTRSTEVRPRNAVRWTLVSMTVTAALAFAAVGTGAVYVANRIARKNALAEAERSARSIAETVFGPSLSAAMAGDVEAITRLRGVVQARSEDGSLVRVKVWDRDGTVVYSDEPSLIGRQFTSDGDVAAVLDTGLSRARLSELDDPENVAESDRFDRLVEVYMPVTLPDGRRYVFESYASDARVQAAQDELEKELVPFALIALLVLLVAQLPVSMWVIRRVARGQHERTRLLRSTLVASARERRNIARELHDGVVQDLAGVGYAVGGLMASPTATSDRSAHTTLEKISFAVQDAVSRLRALMIDIYPPDLTSDGLGNAVHRLAEPLRARGVEVDVIVDLPLEPAPDVAETLYRCAREGFANIARHAGARHVTLTLDGNAETVGLRLHDDGQGMSAADSDRRHEGHFGLSLLREGAADLGGDLQVTSTPGAGTTLTMRLPTSGIRPS